jgi:outer membrane receptor protein involved in Fe transport
MTKMLGDASLLALAATSAISLVPGSAVSQTPTPDRAETQVSEIVVTAEKRSERLQDVPDSITAVSAQQIQSRGVANLMDLQFAIPGMTITEYAPGQERIELRGISDYEGVNTVGRYFDEMPINLDLQQTGPDLRLIDMERVEVLNGPQPTLYGEGSMGGAVRYITAEPNLERFGANLEGQVGSISGGGVNALTDGMVNLPIIGDRVGVRLAAGYESDGGWIDNTYLHEKNINHGTIGTVRASIIFKPTTQDELSLVVQHEAQNQEAQNFGINGVTVDHVPSYSNSNYSIVTGVYKHDFGSFEFVQTGGYLDFRQKTQDDISNYFGPFLTGLGYGTLFTTIGFPIAYKSTVYTEETRLDSTGETALTWLVGVDYRNSSISEDSATYTAPYSLPLDIVSSAESFTSESWAGFGQLGYHVTKKLIGIVGVRYYEDHESFASSSTSFGVASPNNPAPANFYSFDPKFTVEYKFSPDAMVYADVAKGFRSGGFNLSAGGGRPSYRPDELWTYEVGTKDVLFDHKLDIQGDVYYNNWTNVQSTFFLPGSAITNVENGGNVSGWGVDVAANAHPMTGLTLSATYSWNNLAYTTATADHDVGDPVDYAVRESFSASGDYRHPLTAKVMGFVHLDYQHAGPAQITLRDFGGQIIRIPEKNHLNARVGVQFDRYELSIYGSNLTDDRAPVIIGPDGVILENVEQQPLTVGVNAKAHF